MVFTGPNLPHVWRSDNKYFEKESQLISTVIVIYFHDHFMGEALLQKEEMESINRLFQRSVRGLEIRGNTKVQIGKMMHDLLELKGIESIIKLLEILDVMAKSNECNYVTHNHLVSSNTEAETNRMNKIFEYVMRNYKNHVRLDDVAEIVNMTRTSFSRYFKSRVNKTFSDFLKEIRIKHACKLLKEDKMNIENIGYECGFQTLSNFNKQFKTVMGQQPHNYRNEYLKASTDTFRNN
jgi:AraC-like DNA-binding protein